MSKVDLIFSNKPLHHTVRHLLFWIVCGSFYYMQSIYIEQLTDFLMADMHHNAFLSTYCFMPVCVISVYVSLYFIFPFYLQKKKYTKGIVAFIILFLIDVFVNYFFSSIYHQRYIVDLRRNDFFQILSLGYLNSVWAMIISGLALGIKLTINWHLQQKENLEIAKSKEVELQQTKAGLRPEFLLESLKTIHKQINAHSDNAPLMVLKLADLLRFMLYRKKKEFVPIDKELSAMENLIFIMKKNAESGAEIEIHCTVNSDEIFIAPMAVLSLLYETLTMLNQSGPNSYLVTVRVSSFLERLIVNCAFHQLVEVSLKPMNWSLIIENTRGKLDQYYSEGNYLIQMADTMHETIIVLNLPLISDKIATIDISNQKFKESVYGPE